MTKKKPIHGIGMNDASYKVNQKNTHGKWTICPYYTKWYSMLERCYSDRYKKSRPTYKDCLVTNEWLTFSNFKSWMELQDWKGKHLDKDIKIYGNNIYSPDTCLFVSPFINSLLNEQSRSRGLHPLGVSFDKKKGLFMSKCKNEKSSVFLGYFSVPSEAGKAYRNYKASLIKKHAKLNPDIEKYLLNHAKRLLEE